MKIESINPVTGQLLKSYNEMPTATVEKIVDDAHHAFLSWREVIFAERGRLMKRAGSVLRVNREKYSQTMSREMGKPISQARGEVDKCAWVCDYYADHAEEFLRDRPIDTGEGKTFISYQPLGVAFAIMPWNFPFWQVLRFAVPAMMAGNAALLKHSPNVPESALEIEGIFREAGFPAGLFRTLLVDVPAVEPIIADPRVRMVSLTGSVRAGRSVSEIAGRYLKKTVLELGGSDPYVVLADADLEKAVSVCVTSRLINSGQSCIAAKRFIVVKELVESLTTRLVEEMKSKIMGDPMDEATDIGPMAREDLRTALHEQVTKSVEGGATLLLGGELPDGPGYFYGPTVLGNVRPGVPAYGEELFGPVAAVIEAADEEEAIRIANDTSYGLGGAVFTNDTQRGQEIAARRIDSGNVFVNAFVKSDPRVPFGGVKDSGHGRELSWFGIQEYVNIKTVWVA